VTGKLSRVALVSQWSGGASMKRLLLQAPYQLSWDSFDPPRPREGEALVRLRAAGICGSDLNAYRGLNAFQTYPCVPGHELGGEVLAVGAGVSGLRPGDRVTVEPLIYCGRCRPCRMGRYNCCQNLKVLGVHMDGGLAEQVALPAHTLHVAPPELTFEQLALCEPFSVGLHAVQRAKVVPGEWVVVVGSGTIGLSAMQAAKVHGAHVVSLDVVPAKLDLARLLGADVTLETNGRGAVEAVKEITGGDGAPVVIEAVGKRETIRMSLDLVAYAGRIVVIGHSKGELSLPGELIVRKEIDLLGSRNSRDAFPEVISLVSQGKVDMRPLVSHRLPFSEAIEAFELWDSEPDLVTKIVLHFDS